MTHKADRLSYLRALAINTLIQDAADVFITHEAKILEGSFRKALLSESSYKAQVEDIIGISVEKIYQSAEVLDKEIAGYRVIGDLLEVFTGAAVRDMEGLAGNYDKLMLRILPGYYGEADTLYGRLLKTSGYIASLSDGAAVNLHNKITGKML
jgi:dGTPase